MALSRFNFFIAAMISFLFLSGCARTHLDNVWLDANYTGQVSNVLVFAVTSDNLSRQLFETKFSQQLTDRGITAIPGFSLLPSSGMLDRQTILAVAQQKQVDSIIIARLLDSKSYIKRVLALNRSMNSSNTTDFRHSKQDDTYRRSAVWYGKYSTFYASVVNYDYQYRVSQLETGLYLLDGDAIIWTAMTETETIDDSAASIGELVTVLVAQLGKDGLLR